MLGIIRFLLHLWELPDKLPTEKVDLIIGFTLPQDKAGGVSDVLEDLIETVSQEYHISGPGTKVLLENRFKVAGTVLGEVARKRARESGILAEDLLRCPPFIELERIRNTFAEATLAITLTDQPYRVLVVAKELHMRRAWRAAKRATRSYTCDLTRVSAHDYSAYNADTAQWTFRHPLLFCIQEIFALLYSILRKWA